MATRRRSKFISAGRLQTGMKVNQTIMGEGGKPLLTSGTVLDDFMIANLPKYGINGLFIVTSEEEIDENEITISKKAESVAQSLKVADPVKMELTDSVKARVSEGVQFLYSNTESEDFMNATSSITDDLMDAITANNAVALDISRLKVSDEYTFKHSVDVAAMAMIIGKKYGLDDKTVYDLGIAGLLHDVGKSEIPIEVLNKPGRLTDEEFFIMKQHTKKGYDILCKKEGLSEQVLLGVLEHHEKLNGKGYPLGMADKQINLFARIISVSDIFDALVTERPYKTAFSKREAIEMIMSMTEELDISVMKSFLTSVILYPVDSIVALSNGERAKVVENNSGYPMRPKVVELKTGKVYDLANDISCASILIV